MENLKVLIGYLWLVVAALLGFLLIALLLAIMPLLWIPLFAITWYFFKSDIKLKSFLKTRTYDKSASSYFSNLSTFKNGVKESWHASGMYTGLIRMVAGIEDQNQSLFDTSLDKALKHYTYLRKNMNMNSLEVWSALKNCTGKESEFKYAMKFIELGPIALMERGGLSRNDTQYNFYDSDSEHCRLCMVLDAFCRERNI
jgi:hypothetical protein